jgi:FAD/FMN-containing dehydrogenase
MNDGVREDGARPLDRRSFLGQTAGVVASLAVGPWRLARGVAAPDPRLRSLRSSIRGALVTPADALYDAARVVFNRRFDGVRPLGIVRPADVADVRAIVSWARRHDVRLAIRSGGHSYGGYSTTPGLVVDLRALARISVDRAAGTATIGSGARLIDVESTLAGVGGTIPAGSCATVGIGGLALGGGVGFASRRFGTTSDNILSLGIVTADGRALECSAKQNADLYWACRGGGGGNFGVATHFVFRVHRVVSVSHFVIGWPWSQAADVVRSWQDFAPEAPDQLFSICALQTGLRGPTVGVFGQFFGSESELRKLLAPLVRVSGAQLTTGTESYLQTQLRWAGCRGKTIAQCHLAGEIPDATLNRSTFAAKSDYVERPLPRQAVAILLDRVARAQTAGFGSAGLLLDSYGGAINRVRTDATAFVHRDARFSIQYLAYWRRDSEAPAALDWLRAFYAAMRPRVSGFAYQNYIDPDLVTWKHAYYGQNYARLAEIKKHVDPDWFFRFPQGIVPAQ